MAGSKNFSQKLLHWHATQNQRSLPWKGEKDVYKIWLSEIILQQTRAAQGLPYYNAFIKAYPTVVHLANANNEAVFKLWEGLGYYSRCKNLLFTARQIRDDFNGVFPNTYQGLLSLKGVGPYTAAAIASFGFNEPVAVVDGNVVRVMARYFGLHHTFANAEGKNTFTAKAQACLSQAEPAAYNQAIMDFGATICSPKLPKCDDCPFQKSCYAYKNQKQNELPIKANKLTIKNRYFNYLIATCNNQYFIKQRIQNDIWNELYEFILLETVGNELETDIINKFKKTFKVNAKIIAPAIIQKLTHQKISIRFYSGVLKKIPDGFIGVNKNDLKNYGFPISLKNAIDRFIV